MKVKTLLCSIVLSLLFPLFCFSENNNTVVYLTKDSGRGRIDPQPTKKRCGGQQILCEINKEGVVIFGMDTSGIILYEVLDENGMVLASFVSEEEFLSYILTAEETVEICFYFDDFVLSGYLFI